MAQNIVLCVFCGKLPVEKSKEHILPGWLLSLTGDPKRNVNLGYRFDSETGKLLAHSHAFSSFTIPSCGSCNNHYGRLEELVQPVVGSLIAGASLDAASAQLLLDWFDKCRVGLWLSTRTLGLNPFRAAEPKFHINQRIGSSDRALFITRLPIEAGEGLTFSGVGTPLFGSMPSVAGLRINNLLFTSASCAGLLAYRLGLPYLHDKKVKTPNGIFYEGAMKFGTGRRRLPLIRYHYPFPALKIYQPMNPDGLGMVVPRLFAAPYVREHFHSADCERGHILNEENSSLGWLRDRPDQSAVIPTIEISSKVPSDWTTTVVKLQVAVSKLGAWGGPPVPEKEHFYRLRLIKRLAKLNEVFVTRASTSPD